MEAFLSAVEKALGHSRHHVRLVVPYANGGLIDTLHSSAQVLQVEYTAEGIQVEAVLDPILYGRLKDYITGEW